MSKSEQNAARYVVQELLEAPKTMLEISKATGIPRFDLEAFYRAKAGSDLVPRDIEKLEKLHSDLYNWRAE